MIDTRCLSALRLTVAGTVLCLITSTWPLWTGSSSFPQIPFLEALCESGRWADIAGLALVLLGATGTLIGAGVSLLRNRQVRSRPISEPAQRLERLCPWILAAGLGFSILLNQHRLQPWAWHFFLLCPLIAGQSQQHTQRRPGQFAFPAITVLTASIYLFSAVSKLDTSFSAGYGQQLLESLLGTTGASTRFWTDSTRSLAARCLPLGELTIGLLLLARCLSLGAPLSILMHLLLLIALGPFGMHHSPGVLIWNIYFIIQNLILRHSLRSANPTWLSATALRAEISSSATRWSDFRRTAPRLVSVFVFLFGVLFPFLRPYGLCDPWPAWAVYASQPARVTILADQTAAATLPAELQSCLQPRQLDDGQVFVRIDRWSIQMTGAPICPGDRFSLAIARSLSDRTEGQGRMRVVVEGPAGWFSRKRTSKQYYDQLEITAIADSFLFNTRPRKRL